MIWSPAITAALIGVVAALAFGGGFAIADWRMSGKVAKLQGDNSLLSAANDRCAADIDKARIAVEAMSSVAREREKQAAESMKKAQPQVEQHKSRVTRIMKLPNVPVDRQCEAITQEQVEYVRERRAANEP